mmetsp:Transcript_31406/g.50880  ORF Transcript_31406/g.50880 Transcript_31406/m.50880 type:complete len:246 (+) Transcript_31406:34-771(+)
MPARKRSRQEPEIDEDHDDEALGPPMTYMEFVEELDRYIYEKSAQDLDRLLSNNQLWLAHEMPDQQLFTALCDGTINNKIELNEAPVETLKILKKHGFDLTADELEPIRSGLLYSHRWFAQNDHITMALYDMIEYVLSVEEDLSIQSFDCRQLILDVNLDDKINRICNIDSVQGVDSMVSLAFVGINEIRQERKIKLEKYLYDVCDVVQPSNSIIAEFIFGSYVFHCDGDDYDPQTGEYKENRSR